MSSTNHPDAQLVIDDALADIERACQEFKENDETIQLQDRDTNILTMSKAVMSCAQELILTKFRLNSLEEIYRDTIHSLVSSTVDINEHADVDSIPKGSHVLDQLKDQAESQLIEPTEFPSLRSLKTLFQVQRKSTRSNVTSNDLEVLENESESVLIDPISKKPIEHPVRNKRCKHIYDKSSILKFITSMSNPRCPNMGCVNKTTLTRDSIEDVSLDEV